MRALLQLWLIASCIACGFCRPAAAVDRLEEFNRAKRSIAQSLRSKQPEDRIAAIKKLQGYPFADGVKLLNASLADSEEQVRQAALDSLIAMSDKQEVCDTVLLLAKKAVHRHDDGEVAAPLLAVLLSSDLPSAQRNTSEFLEKTTANVHGLQVVLTLIDELGQHGSERDVELLLKLSKTKAFAEHFGIRRALVQALTQISKPQAIGALIELMDKIKGEAQADAVEHLTQLTDQIFGMEARAWKAWWDDVKDKYEYPKRTVQAPYRSAMTSMAGNYYGLPLFAEKLVFVLDTSGSMTGQRIDAAKRELVRAIAGLPDHVEFGIVVFNDTATVWQKQLVAATEQAKRAATVYVNSQSTHSNTASYDALEAAFHFDTEAIYFLSDGEPRGGKIPAPADIIAAITTANKTRRVSLYTIGIGAGFPGSPLDTFMHTLADQNYGLYRRVDN